MSRSSRRPLAATVSAFALTAMLVLVSAAPAHATSLSGTKTCSASLHVALYSDQIGSGFHYYQSGSQVFLTNTPPGVRKILRSQSGYSVTAWTANAGTLYSAAVNCELP